MVRKRTKTRRPAAALPKPISNAVFQWTAETATLRDKFCNWAQRQVGIDPAAWRFHVWEISWTPSVVGHFSKMPIPVDARLATALPHLRRSEAVPFWELLIHNVPLWVSDAFCSAGRSELVQGSGDSSQSGLSTAGDDQAFREESELPNSSFDVGVSEFDAVCDAVSAFIAEAVSQNVVRLGCVLNLIAFPLGRGSVRSVPLIGGHWISEPALELIVFSQTVRRDKLACLPPIDPNSGAFERVFPIETMWPSDAAVDADQEVEKLPTELEGEDLDAYCRKAREHVRQLKLQRRSFDGQPYLNAAQIERRDDDLLRHTVSLGVVNEMNTGVIIEDWNRWVRETRPKVSCGGIDVTLGHLRHSGTFPNRYDLVAVDDREKLHEMLSARRALIQSLLLDCRNHYRESLFSEAGIMDPQPGEKRIVAFLFRRARKAEELQTDLGCDRRTVFKWLERIRDKQIVANDRSMGGYYLPAFPPPENTHEL
jgi:hypothetical protein